MFVRSLVRSFVRAFVRLFVRSVSWSVGPSLPRGWVRGCVVGDWRVCVQSAHALVNSLVFEADRSCLLPPPAGPPVRCSRFLRAWQSFVDWLIACCCTMNWPAGTAKPNLTQNYSRAVQGVCSARVPLRHFDRGYYADQLELVWSMYVRVST